MADNTLIGILAIVGIVLVTAVFLQFGGDMQTTPTGNIAAAPAVADTADCDPGRFCDGSKLVIVREDCSLAQAFCQSGCDKQALVCR